MISIIVTAWEEPIEVRECLRRIINQKNLDQKYEVLAIAPDTPTIKEIKNYCRKYPKIVKFFLQPREKGKNEMLNFLMKKAKGDILVFTDGDIFLNDIAVSEIAKFYNDPKVGAVTGRILPKNSKKTRMGFWAHTLTNVINKMRDYRFKKGMFIECSGYLYSIRSGLIKDIPLDVAEDSVMPLMIFKKGYKIAYAEKAMAFVGYPENFKSWLSQKVRCAKAHEKLGKYGSESLKMKSFSNEIFYGLIWSIGYGKSFKEFIWLIELYLARLYVWLRTFIDTKILNHHYGETWNKVHGIKN
jgi:cellulose synthase/poly-beta-1,6-N-acetylglucosamine synthase-like glycosyltransferase